MIIGATLGLIAIKAAVLFGLAVVFKLRGRDRFLFCLSLAQGGEFGFVVVSFARSEGAMTLATGQATLLVISLSMLLTPLCSCLRRPVAADRAGDAEQAPDRVDERGRS